MANSVKYNTSAESLALNTGNFWIGTGDVAKGPTSTTDFWSAINPSNIDNDFADGYTIYVNKSTQGPSIRVASSDAELITITNQISGNSYATINDCFDYFITQDDKFVLNSYINPIVTDELVLAWDASLVPSYPRNGTSVKDLSGGNDNGTFQNTPTFNTIGSFNFDGVDSRISTSGNPTYGNNTTWEAIVKVDSTVGVNYNMFMGRHLPYFAFRTTTSKFHFSNTIGGTQQNVYSTNTFQLDIWYHLLFTTTYNGSTTEMKIWVNGEDNGGSSFSGVQGNPSYTFAIGDGRGGTVWYPFDGEVSKVRVYSKTLTTNEMLQNYYQAPIVTDGLVFAVDPGNLVSYEDGATTTYSLINSYTGTLSGVTYNGSNGGTWNFDGTNDYITLPDDIGYTTAVSTFAWYKSNGTPGSTHHIICGDSGLEISIPHSSGLLRTGIDTSDARYVNNLGSTNLVDGEWHYIGFTFSGTTKTSYIDGVSVGTQTTIGDLISDVSPRALGEFPGGYQANGNMGLYTVYNREITASEVSQNYGAGKGRFSNVSIAPQA